MTPQEKAEQMVFDMEQRIEQACNQSSRQAHNSAAIQCALLAAEEVILNIDKAKAHHKVSFYLIVNKNYWVKIRSALNNMQ